MSKCVYRKLGNKVNRSNNTYRTIKMMFNLLILSGLHIFTLMLKIMKKILNLKFAFISEHQNKKNTFRKGYKLNWSEAFVIKKVKYTVPWLYVIEDSMEKKLLEQFM